MVVLLWIDAEWSIVGVLGEDNIVDMVVLLWIGAEWSVVGAMLRTEQLIW